MNTVVVIGLLCALGGGVAGAEIGQIRITSVRQELDATVKQRNAAAAERDYFEKMFQDTVEKVKQSMSVTDQATALAQHEIGMLNQCIERVKSR